MKNIQKRLMAFALTLIFGISASISAFAVSSSPITVLRNDTQKCIVKEITDEGVTIATNDKTTGILTVEKFDASQDTLISTETMDLNAITQSVENNSNIAKNSAMQASGTHVYQHTFSNREYDIYFYSTRTVWEIRAGGGIKGRDETKSNKSNLNNFRNAVDKVNSAEFTLIGAVGSTVAATAITAFLSGGLAAGIAAAGGSAAAVAAFGSLDSAISSADYYFARV